MAEYIEVVTTTATRDDVERIARSLIESRLAACVQIRGPIHSTYRWQGNVVAADEWQCVAKTRRDLYSRVEQAITELHPYEVPEILAVAIVEASRPYVEWLDGQLAR